MDDSPPSPKGPSNRTKARMRRQLNGLFTRLAMGYVRLVCATLRIRSVDEHHFFGLEGGKILCLWHGRTMPPTARLRGYDITVLISLSRDGELIAKVLAALGFPALRGSSGPSGARVLASCIKLLRSGRALAVTPDGPRGPSMVLQNGVIAMARKSGCALVPVGSSVRPRFVMRSWDRFLAPLPFSRAVMVFGEPMHIAHDADEAEMEDARLRLQTEMRRLQDDADRRLRVPTFAQLEAKQA